MVNSPAEDFSKTTLAALPGTIEKLRYVAGLRQEGGKYYHWGMASRHGETNSNLAIAQAHTQLFLSMLRTPVRSLWEEARSLADDQSATCSDYISTLMANGDLLIPSELQGGARRHFNSVLVALCYLAGVKAPTTGQVA